ncbi:MAG: radical SAM protein [Anaerovoracaceae bacterium]
MNIESKKDVMDVLAMPQTEFWNTVAVEAKQLHRSENGNTLIATAMLGFDNICKNQCLYCGMRASNAAVERYRLEPDRVLRSGEIAAEMGFRRIFLISGEDPKYGFENILKIVEALNAKDFFISLAIGELSKNQYVELKNAGADEYVLKFEMSQREVFNRMKPSTDYDRRMKGIGWIKESGLELASGSIVDYPGQTAEQLAEDLLLTRDLGISWAPVIPYMPAKGTPLALEGGSGSTEKNLKVISMLRIMMPRINITAQQPGKDLSKGLADPQGNLDALNAGANMLFADMLPDALARNFSVVDNRITLGLDHIQSMARKAFMPVQF